MFASLPGFLKTSCTRSTLLLPDIGAPSCINSPRSVHARSVLRRFELRSSLRNVDLYAARWRYWYPYDADVASLKEFCANFTRPGHTCRAKCVFLDMSRGFLNTTICLYFSGAYSLRDRGRTCYCDEFFLVNKVLSRPSISVIGSSMTTRFLVPTSNNDVLGKPSSDFHSP